MSRRDEDDEPYSDAPYEPPEPAVTMMPIRPFKAFDGSGDALEVVGVCFWEDMPQFVVIEEEEGEIWPRFRGQVFKDAKSAQGAIT